MAITKKSIKILWGNAASQCAFLECSVRLSQREEGEIAPYTIGEMAHIKGNRPNSNRYDPEQDQQERDDYTNLILLCPNHHALIDKKENEEKYSVNILQQIKADHENFIIKQIDTKPQDDISSIASIILPFLSESHQAWLNYGPLSDIAKKNPHSNQAYAIWQTERLSTIVPNNRRISEVLRTNKEIFQGDALGVVKSFLFHADSYEQWVQDKIPYQAVVPFPEAFDKLIRGYIDASS